VTDSEGNTYSLRVRPYVTLEKAIDGASLVLIESDPQRRKTAPPRQAPGEENEDG
jgi:hypothetical protein